MPDVLEAADAPFRLTAPIEHITKLDDGTILAHVVVTSETPDTQGEIVDYDAFKAAAPGLMKWAVLGEMHDPERHDAGTILRLYFDDAERRVEADIHVVDPIAVRKVLSRVYKMVSIGGVKLAVQAFQQGGRTLRRITKLIADELSLVPRGANPDAMLAKQFILAKREADMPDTDAGTASPLGEPVAGDGRTPEQIAIDATRELLKAEAADPNVGGGRVRANIPDSDYVFPEDAPDGGFPIASAGDVTDAVNSWGRYEGPHSFEEFKSRLTSIANRKGYPLPKAWRKEQRKMAKAAEAAQAASVDTNTTTTAVSTGTWITTPAVVVPAITVSSPVEPIAKAEEAPAPPAEEEPKTPFPGAKPPFKGKKAARKAAKIAKAAARKARLAKIGRIAKGNKTVKLLAEALEAITCAMSEEADEGDQDAVKAFTTIAAAIQEQMTTEAMEGEHGEDDDEFDPDMAMAYAKGRRALAKKAPRLLKRAGAARRTVAKLRKDRRALRKAAAFTSVLTKSGARNSASDLAKIDAIHAATVDLGTSAHRVPEAPLELTPASTDKGGGETSPIAKADTTSLMREALAGLLPTDKIEAIERRLAAQAETAKAQGELLEKIAKMPTGGGPTLRTAEPVYRGQQEPTDKASALAKAAEVIDDPRLKEQVGDAAALEMIRAQRGG